MNEYVTGMMFYASDSITISTVVNILPLRLTDTVSMLNWCLLVVMLVV